MKTILFVFDTAFNGGWLGSTRRLLDTAAGLSTEGWNPYLLAAKPPAPGVGVAQEQAFPGRVLRTPFVHGYPAFVGGRYQRWAWRQWASLTGRSYQLEDPETGWGPRVVTWWRNQRIDVVPDVIFAISSGGFDSFVAGRNLARHFQVPMVLEFRDPVPNPAHPAPSQKQLLALESCLDEASAIITTTSSLAEHMARTDRRIADKVHAVHSWFDDSVASPRSEMRAAGPLRLLHAGTLTGESARNARALVKAIAHAKEGNASLDVELRLLGGGRGGEEATLLANDMGIGASVVSLPPCSPEEAHREMERADVLIVIKYADPRFRMQIPGKLFQYLGLGKPILGIMGPSEAAEILQSSRLGVVVENDDVEGISQRIAEFFDNKTGLRDLFRADSRYVAQYSRRNLLQKLNEILEQVVAESSQHRRKAFQVS